MAGRGREAPARIARQLRDALGALLDQRTPFGRLALTHVVMTAGDTLVTISLAGSLFFSISPEAAKGKVILYLVLTMTPFAVVAPLLGPLIDRSRGARRAMVVTSAACRAAMCYIMANDLKSLLLFPEAFALLVLSKVYLVTKGSLVPLVTVSGARRSGAEISPMVDEPALAAGAPAPDEVDHEELANANARLGLLASLTGFAASVPAIVVLKLLGGPWVLRLDMVVFAFGVVVALRLPIGRSVRGRWGEHRRPAGGPVPAAASAPGGEPWASDSALSAFSTRANTHPEVVLALSAMSILRGLVGFLTFLLAFSLRRAGSATWWYGLFLAATVAGAVVGVMLVPRARRVFTEPQMLALSIWSVALAGVLAAVVGGLVVQVLLAFVIGLASAAAKPAFDALVQRYVPTAAQGRAFARFETRLQLVWVLGALLPVVSALPLVAGDMVIAAVAGVAGLSYLTSRRALRHRWSADR